MPASTTCSSCCSRHRAPSWCLRQIPTFSGDLISGFVDLALERAFVYKEHAASEVIPLEGDAADREKTARFSMLETLADHDDELMEQLLEDIQPPRDKIFDDLTHELREGLVCPVLMGTATRTNGVLRLLKALRHESPGIAETAKRLGVKAGGDAVAYVLKTLNTAHGGQMSIARVLAGQAGDGTTFFTGDDEAGRVAGVFKLVGQNTEKRGPATAGETVAFAKLDKAKTGDTLTAGKQAHAAARQGRALSAGARHRHHGQGTQGRREARPGAQQARRGRSLDHHRAQPGDPRSGAVGPGRDASAGRHRAARRPLRRRHRAAPAERRLPRDHSQRRACSAAATRNNPAATASTATSCSTSSRCRAARASRSRTRSPAAWCRATIFPSVEEGVVDALKHGPLGFPVVDLHVALVDGSYHTVDSSDMAFRTAGRIGIVEGLPQCQPVLLEPIHQVEIVCPTEATAKINALMSGRRGQILGFDTREGWEGWDMVRAKMPEAEIGDLIVEVRSATAGAGTFTFKFDHMAEFTGRTADQIVAARRAAE